VDCEYTVGLYCGQDKLVYETIELLKEQKNEISRISNEYLKLVKVASKQPQIVRCKDCKHAVAQDCEQVWCSFVDDGLSHEPDWFCADGERKEGR